MTRPKGTDEVFCTACGERITQRAAVCPACGVANDHHQPEGTERDVSDSWRYGVLAGIGLWIAGVALAGAFPTVAGLLYLVAWPGLAVSVYYDHLWVEANTDWNPETAGWVTGAVLPLVCVPVAVAYLLVRRRASPVESEPADRIERLQNQYAAGEISHAEFEREVDASLADADRREPARARNDR